MDAKREKINVFNTLIRGVVGGLVALLVTITGLVMKYPMDYKLFVVCSIGGIIYTILTSMLVYFLLRVFQLISQIGNSD